jgi:NAD(P)-dependent dehydrogenase (short-subunit alcohol dehydrogenase family)
MRVSCLAAKKGRAYDITQKVVSLMLYLASEDAGYITGQAYLMNGGLYFH